MNEKILVIGALGQIGTELIEALTKKYGNDAIIATDIRPENEITHLNCLYIELNVLDSDKLLQTVKSHKVTQVYLLAALLSATAEKNPQYAWDLNMNSLLSILNLAKLGRINKVYWPSSIAVFGPTTPRHNTPQFTVMEPDTVYGISKLAGERWCEYYFKKYNVDVRSLRYPGLIGWKSAPGGGTTDYAVHIFHEALKHKKYTSFLSENTELPMMYMDDAIEATIRIMEAPFENVKIRSSYNLAGFSFTPSQLAQLIGKRIPNFSISYQSDFRQQIADSWPASIDDSRARQDWAWQSKVSLNQMVDIMLDNLENDYK
jgi:nucleoside-diphosphate-sugar epimerase